MYLTHLLCNYIVNLLQKNNFIKETQVECYLYCYDYLLCNLSYSIVITLISIFLFNTPLFGIIFQLTLFPLRSTCGGLHAPNRQLCTICSILVFFLCWIVSLTLKNNPYTIFTLYTICFIVILKSTTILTIKEIAPHKKRF